MKINGNTVGTTMPRTNYNQTDPKKADYLVGRENILGKDELASVTEEILAEAKASGEFDGEAGISPVVSVEEIDGGHRITIKDIYGTKTIDVMDGVDGADGYSPIRGTDYWTDADKASIVTDVINALPTWEGGSY